MSELESEPASADAAETMDDDAIRTVSLGEIDPARSRHMWTRSAVHATDDLIVAGQWDGTVTAFELEATSDALEARWTVAHPDHAVGIETLDSGTDGDLIVVAGRGDRGTIAAYDAATGDRRWRYDTADDVGEATDDSIFSLPYTVALEADDETETLYATARRYERDGDRRRWHSTVYAFDADGTVRWRYETDASPIALELAADGERLAVGYNRCMGDHDTGLVVLEAETGEMRWTWDPGTAGDRRVGDVSFDGDSIAVASHGDKRGYLLGSGGAERWRVDLAVETDVGGERLYAYPNHASAHDGRVAFVTGNTYAVENRETDGRHPNEHRLAVFDASAGELETDDGAGHERRDGGDCRWDAHVRGFVHGLDADGNTVVAPCAQNFRVRDPETHALRRFDLESGVHERVQFDGIVTAAAVAGAGTGNGTTVAAIEEPVEYHDESDTRGEYALHVASLS